MNVRRDDRGSRMGAVTCMLVGACDKRTMLGIQQLVTHAEAGTKLMIVGPMALLEQLQQATNEPFEPVPLLPGATAPADALGRAIDASAPYDLLLVCDALRVGPGWVERLRASAHSDSTVATATPFSIGPGGVKLKGAKNLQLGERDKRIAARSLQLRPRIASAGPSCVYLRRDGLELIRPLTDATTLDHALELLALDQSRRGMLHVLADDVVVESLPGGPGRDLDRPCSAEIEGVIEREDRGAFWRARNRVVTTLDSLTVTIDGRALTNSSGGTQTYIIELILAIARAGAVKLRVLLPPDVSPRAAAALAGVPSVETLTYAQALENPPLTHVVHRPQQIFTADDLSLLRMLGERVVIGHQDLIAYHNHSYHPDLEAWRAYRRTTRIALAVADQAIFFSEHARRDALGEDLLAPTRTHVVGVGREPIESLGAEQSRPGPLAADEHFLLCLGADYAHKNRPFAIELLHELRALGWGGRLVLAGAHVPHGSSRAAEQRMLGNGEDENLVIDLGPVDEATRRWLYAHARALVYPTTYEGFGLLPLEAARAGLPCLFAAQASLAEIAGAAATLVPWDARASAEAVLPLLGEGVAREAHLKQLRDLTIPSWSEVAAQLIAVYEQAVAQPGSEAAPRLWQDLERERYIVRLAQDIDGLKATAQEYQDLYHSLHARVRGGLALIDEDGLLTPAQQRGLMRVAVRRRFAGVVLAPFGLIGRLRRDRFG